MNYIFIIIVIALIIFWIMNDLFNFFEFFNAGICTTSDGTFGNFYDNTCHPLGDSNAPSSDSDYTSPTTGEETGSWTNTGTINSDTNNGASAGAGDGSNNGTGSDGSSNNTSSKLLKDTTKDDCIDNIYAGTICNIRNPGSNKGLKSIIQCTGENSNKSKFECENLWFNETEYKNVINATSCVNKSIDFDEACRIFQPIDNLLKTQGYNINSIGSKQILYGKNGDCYDSAGKEDFNKGRALCSYKYNTNITKLDHIQNNYDYNVFTGCQNIKSNFNQECKTLLGKTGINDKVYAYINGFDCLPGFGRAKCVDKSKPINETENMKQFMKDANIAYFRGSL
jgi:hypothetical protein